MKILVVEDDDFIAQAVAETLQRQRCLIDVAVDGQEGWELATAFNYDLILLDVILPKLDGISLCRQLRQKGEQVPILMLTAKDTSTDKVLGLDAGADDYVVKPFDFPELIARIRALLRRGSTTLPPVLEWGALRLDPSNCEVAYGQQLLHLTPREYALLELFLRNARRTFSRSEIVDRLWNLEDPPQEDTIKSYIKSLRHKLKAAGAPSDFIETVYGLGYRLKPLLQEEPFNLEPTASDLDEMQQEILSAVVKFREVFTAGLSDRLAVLKQAVAALGRGTLSDELQQQAGREAHKLAGSLGSFGFTQASQLAQEIETLLEAKDSRNTHCLRLCQLLEKLEAHTKQTPAKADLSKLFLSQELF